MSCDLEYSVVHSYFDGELGVIRVAEFKHHLADCSDCMDEFAAGIVDAHLRSLLPGQITNVNSSDPQTVGTWFDGKVKFVFPVRNFADDGFALQGGRVDIVQGRTVAALVYRGRDQLFNVFI